MNKVILMGRLTKDPELRYAQDNTSVCTFTIAVDRNLNREKKEQLQIQGKPTADFIRCIVFRNTAEMIGKYFNKGKKILIEGHIQTGSYQNRDGATVWTTDVIVERFHFVESNQNNQNGNYGNGRYQNGNQANYNRQQNGQRSEDLPDDFFEINDDDIPFL